MLLQDILQDADMLADNSLSTDLKIRYFNQVQRKLYRDFPLLEEAYYFQTQIGVIGYDLPPDCTPEQVRSVFIDDKEYVYVTNEDAEYGMIYTIANGQIVIYPAPTQHSDGYINYMAEPADLTSADLTNEPPFIPDYHELLVLGIAAKIALVMKDYQQADQLEVRYQNLLTDAIRKIKRIKIKRIRQVRRWS